MNDATFVELRDAATGAGDREVWKALAVGMIAAIRLGRLPGVGLTALKRVTDLIGHSDSDEHEATERCSRENR
ncbi:MAG: hypothetical protein IPK82_20240 [Polyangiaceae bacterium]|nr:hypothetical protein [Polyangiaceae bacterium]